MNINDLTENEIINLDNSEYFAGILGTSPSKGARSPVLWNSAFRRLNISCHMHPFDVLPNNLGKIVEYLKLNKKFIGGSITIPYKKEIIKYLEGIDDDAKKIGAVNCIYRNEKGKLIGANTDGAGALWSLQSAYGDLNGARVLLLGAGGAALAVATFIGKSIGKKGKLFIANRNKSKSDELIQMLSNTCAVDQFSWPVSKENKADIDILINCTSIGFDAHKKDNKGYYSLKFFSPIGEIKDDVRLSSVENFEQDYANKAAKNISKNFYQTNLFLSKYKKLFVFDIVYQPKITCLLFISSLMGHKILTGNGMNLEQAVIAFYKTVIGIKKNKLSKDEVRNYMLEVF